MTFREAIQKRDFVLTAELNLVRETSLEAISSVPIGVKPENAWYLVQFSA